MTAKQEALNKVAEAERVCSKVQAAWAHAEAALAGGVSVNGYGIYHDRDALRRKLEDAQAHIAEALCTLNSVVLPSNADYDQL